MQGALAFHGKFVSSADRYFLYQPATSNKDKQGKPKRVDATKQQVIWRPTPSVRDIEATIWPTDQVAENPGFRP